MKKLSQKNKAQMNLRKLQIFIVEKLSEGIGHRPMYPQGTRPLTHFRALPEPILAGRLEKGALVPFSAQTG